MEIRYFTILLMTIGFFSSCSNDLESVMEELNDERMECNSNIRTNEDAAKDATLLYAKFFGDVRSRSYSEKKDVSKVDFLASKAQSRSNSSESGFYIVNFSSGGFAVISNQKEDNTLYGVSEKGYLDISKNEMASDFIESYKDSIPLTPEPIGGGGGLKPYNPEDQGLIWEDVNTGIVYIVYSSEEKDTLNLKMPTSWGQEAPYNLRYPIHEASGMHFLSGCVPTAVAQICAFHKKAKLPVSINWDQMLSDKNGSLCSQEGQYDISTLFYYLKDYCSVEFFPEQDIFGTWHLNAGSNINHASNAFEKLGYKSPQITTDINKIFDSLKFNGPVYMRGEQSSGSGHAWVVTGYINKITHYTWHEKDNPYSNRGSKDINNYTYLKFNWGWNGNGDGYYLISSEYRPYGFNFSNDFKYIINIKK